MRVVVVVEEEEGRVNCRRTEALGNRFDVAERRLARTSAQQVQC
jgi:hypothetical protein